MQYDFRTVQFTSGSHKRREEGMCFMEAASYIAGHDHSDKPACVCPVISAYCRRLNDLLPDDSTRTRILGPYLWRVPGTVAPRATLQRVYMCADTAVRVFLANKLDILGIKHGLRDIKKVINKESAACAASCAASYASSAASAASAATSAAYFASSSASAAYFASSSAYFAASSAYFAAAAAASAATCPWDPATDLLDLMISLTEIREIEFKPTNELTLATSGSY